MRNIPFWLIWRTLRHQRQQTIAMLGASALATAVIVGSLVTGDSMDSTLRQQALDRVGKTDVALVGGDRLFRPELAGDLETVAAGESRNIRAASIFTTFASASTGSNARRVNQVQVLGIDAGFAGFSPSGEFPVEPMLEDDSPTTKVVINDVLASRLDLAPGDNLVLRPRGPSELSADAPMADAEQEPTPLRARVTAIVGPEDYGRFALHQTPEPMPLVFLARDRLLRTLDQPPSANLLLLRNRAGDLSPAEADEWLEQAWKPADLALRLDKLASSGNWQVSSRRVFIDRRIAEKITEAIPGAYPVLSYFVNRIASRDEFTPFSFVAAVNPEAVSFLPDDMDDDTFAPNQWLVDDLDLSEGDPLRLTFFLSQDGGGLREQTTPLVAGPVLPMQEPSATPDWTPEFPGLSTAEDCDDWETSLPIDIGEVRDKDEDYWDEWRATPKGFITLAKGRELWSNRWGQTTAILLPGHLDESSAAAAVREALSPTDAGLHFTPLRANALSASKASVDFGGLLIGFGFFVIAAAVGLSGLLFAMTIDQRASQIGLLRAVGWRPGRIRALLYSEAFLLSLLAALVGLPLGVGLALGLVHWIEWLWPSTGGLRLIFAVAPSSLLTALLIGTFLPLLAVAWTVRRASRFPARQLLAGETPSTAQAGAGGAKRGRRKWLIVTVLCILGAVAGLLWAFGNPMAPGAFFAGAFFLVLAGLAAFRTLLAGGGSDRSAFKLRTLGQREAARNPWRTLAITGSLAAGTFLVISSAAFRKQAPVYPEPSGPTGGFEWTAETSAPITDGLERANLPAGTEIVGFRLSEGSDASCLNLGSVQQPRLMGVDPETLKGRFTFAGFRGDADGDKTWEKALQVPDEEDDPIPAVIDETTLMWSLKAKLGDRMILQDEFGENFEVVFNASLAAGILQGGLILPEQSLLDRFPSLSGDRFFLIDLPDDIDTDTAQTELNRAYRDAGMEIRSSLELLQSYNSIENTYIAMFQVLGGFGLLLATAGIGLIAARNLRERAGQHALLHAVGWSRTSIRQLARIEFFLAAGWGMGIGLVASALAVWPQLAARSGSGGLSWLLLTLLVLAIAAGSWLAIRIAVATHLRDTRPQALEIN